MSTQSGKTDRLPADIDPDEAERLFRLFADSLPQVYWVLAGDMTHMEYVSPAYEEIWGRPVSSLQDRPLGWLEAVHPDDRAMVESRIADRRTGKIPADEVGDFEYRIIRPDGTVRWLRTLVYPILGSDGTLQRLAGIAAEITAFKRVETELDEATLERAEAERERREAQVRFERLANEIPDCFWSTSISGGTTRVVYVSPGWKRIWGFEPEEIYADADLWVKAIIPEDVAAAEQAFRKVISERCSCTAVYRVRSKDGTLRWVEDRMSPILDGHGNLTGLDGVARDITASKLSERELRSTHDLLESRVRSRTAALEQANERLEHSITERIQTEDALRESEERFRQLAENVDEVFWLYDPSGGSYLFVNAAYESIWGRPRDRIYADSSAMYAAVHDEDRPRVDRAREVQPLGERTQIEYRILRPDGGTRWIWERAFPIAGSEGTVARIAGIAEDITARKESEEALRRSERLASLGTLAAGIAHEINNPVGGILLAAQFARMKIAESTDVLRALADIEEDAKRCGHIVRGILRLARHDSSEKQACCLNDVATSAIRITEDYAVEKNASIRFHPAARLPKALINRTEMEQAIVNLIRNAIEAQEGGATIEVRTAVHENRSRVIVSDDGPGLTPEQLSHLFDPFYTTRRARGGYGLGLSLAHAVVTDHRGAIEVESTPGNGATFTIELPGTQGVESRGDDASTAGR